MSLKQDFNKYFDYLVKEGKLSSCTIKDLCYKCYCQGTTRISSKEVSIEEVEKWLENKEFFDFIESCISHPEQMKNECSNSGIVKIVYPCTAEKNVLLGLTAAKNVAEMDRFADMNILILQNFAV